MSLSGDKSGFGLDVESRLNRRKQTTDPNAVRDDVYTHNDTHTPKVRERKTFRAQILTYPSLIEKLDNYAQMNGLSRTEAFERAVTEFLERNT